MLRLGKHYIAETEGKEIPGFWVSPVGKDKEVDLFWFGPLDWYGLGDRCDWYFLTRQSYLFKLHSMDTCIFLIYLRLCLISIKYFLEMLFSRKKNVFKLFGCLKIRFTKNQFRCLVRSNIFTKNSLHSQATQFSIHFLSCKHVDNESIPHSFTKETKPNKKIHQIRSNWDRAT